MSNCSSQAERVVVVAHTAELRLTEAEMRKAEGVQADAPVEQVAAAVGLRVAAELHRMWASPCSVWSQCAHGAVQVRGTETEFLGEGLPCFRKKCVSEACRAWDKVQAKEEVHCAASGLNTLPGVAPGVPISAQPAVEAVGTWVAGKLRQMWATDNSTWVECEHGAVCASSGEGQQCQFAGTVCSRPGCVKKAQEWWVPIVSAAKQHVTASDGVAHAGGATARAAFSLTDWAPPSQTPSLKGETRRGFLDQCSHWYLTPKAKIVPCRVLRVEPSGKAWVRFWAAERAVSQQRVKREPTAAVGSFIIGLLEDEGVASGPAEDTTAMLL